MSNFREKLKTERYFAAGLVGAIFALYTVSTFLLFSNSESIDLVSLQSNHTEQITVASKPAIANNDQLMMIMGKVQSHGVFSPLGEGTSTVPGVECKVTDQNLDFRFNFKNIPETCFKVLDEE